MEQFIKKTCDELMAGIKIPLYDILRGALMAGYNKGWEACKKFYHIDDDKFLKEQEEIETKYMGSYKTTASTDNSKKCKDYRKENKE